MALKIKKNFQNTVIAYNNSGIPLKGRSEDDITDLAIMAVESNDPSLINLFEDKLPSIKDLVKIKMAFREKKVIASPSTKEVENNSTNIIATGKQNAQE